MFTNNDHIRDDDPIYGDIMQSRRPSYPRLRVMAKATGRSAGTIRSVYHRLGIHYDLASGLWVDDADKDEL